MRRVHALAEENRWMVNWRREIRRYGEIVQDPILFVKSYTIERQAIARAMLADIFVHNRKTDQKKEKTGLGR
jgi:hypothetical protein